MKFGREFQEDLEKGDYPQDWIESAIPYRKLKKCIKKVQRELKSLGLDHETLLRMYQQNGNSTDGAAPGQKLQSLSYTFEDGDARSFTPKLTIALDPRDGSPMDAWLSPDTRRHLRDLAISQHKAAGGASHLGVAESLINQRKASVANVQSPGLDQEIEIVEVPLTADSEFFRMLRREIIKLEQLQKRQQEQLKEQIHLLGQELAAMKSSSSKDKQKKANIEAWREIFRLYTESQIFFSSHEQDAGARDVEHAQKQLQLFSNQLAKEQGTKIKLDGSAKAALDRFLRINLNLLQFLRFQDINRTALTKIMKKFDKQTALPAQESLPKSLTQAPFIARDLARATAFTISEELLTLLPQLDDYLCPVCFSLAYKPMRLQCGHVFCVRCLLVMQRAEQDHCPLCREPGVLEVSSLNLDKKLQAFLKANFPNEVKAKQRENEFAAGVDRFGEDFKGTHKCVVM
jgi:E3 ubiquitin-protein ligase BAH